MGEAPDRPDPTWIARLRPGDEVAIARDGKIERRQTVARVASGLIYLNAPIGTPGMTYDCIGWEFGWSVERHYGRESARYLVQPPSDVAVHQ